MDLGRFLTSFWCHFVTFSVGFLALANHAFSMTLPCEINVFGFKKALKTDKTGFEFRLEFSTSFLQGNSSKFGQKWTENRTKFRQKPIRKINAFLDDAGSSRGYRSEAGRQAVGVGGTIQIPFNSIQILQKL